MVKIENKKYMNSMQIEEEFLNLYCQTTTMNEARHPKSNSNHANDQIKYSLTSLEIRKLTIMRPFSEICYDNEMSQGSLSFLFAFIPTLFQLQPKNL